MNAVTPRLKVAAFLVLAVIGGAIAIWGGAVSVVEHNAFYPIYSVAVVETSATPESLDPDTIVSCRSPGCSVSIGYVPPRAETDFGMSRSAVLADLGITEARDDGVITCIFPSVSPYSIFTAQNSGTAFEYRLQRSILGIPVGERSRQLSAFESASSVYCDAH